VGATDPALLQKGRILRGTSVRMEFVLLLLVLAVLSVGWQLMTSREKASEQASADSRAIAAALKESTEKQTEATILATLLPEELEHLRWSEERPQSAWEAEKHDPANPFATHERWTTQRRIEFALNLKAHRSENEEHWRRKREAAAAANK